MSALDTTFWLDYFAGDKKKKRSKVTPSLTELTSKPINTVKRALSRINKKSKSLKGRGNVKSLIRLSHNMALSNLEGRRRLSAGEQYLKNVKKLKKFVNKIVYLSIKYNKT